MIDVTCAIIEKNNEILIAQRSENMHLALKWEFPGGKIDKNESPENCIIREIREELCMNITPVKLLKESIYDYGTKTIKLIPFVCLYNSGTLLLKEHKNALWVRPTELGNYDWCEADLPIINSYLEYISTKK